VTNTITAMGSNLVPVSRFLGSLCDFALEAVGDGLRARVLVDAPRSRLGRVSGASKHFPRSGIHCGAGLRTRQHPRAATSVR